MKWTVLAAHYGQEAYQLTEGDHLLLSLEFHPFTNAARMKYSGEKRAFLIRKEGFLRNRMVLRNEYGVLLGQLANEKANLNSGNMEFGEEKFRYEIVNNDGIELIIYKEHVDEPFVRCGVEGNLHGTPGLQPKLQQTGSVHSLLLALCWYKVLPVKSGHGSIAMAV